MALETDWIKVATSGPTVDGREIPAEDLADMAETYNTAEYTANINIDHWRWYGNFGQVSAVKAEQDSEDRTCLFAKIRPNQHLVELNKQGQKLFTSIEIWENFADSGKAYLGALAVTDEPASIGTQALQFSKKNNISAPVYSKPIPFSLSADEQTTDDLNTDSAKDSAATDGLIHRFVSAFASALGGSALPPENTTPPDTPVEQPPEDDEMKPEQFNQLLEAQQKTNDLMGTLVEKFTKETGETEGPDGADSADGDQGNNDTQETGVTAEQFQTLIDGQAKMTEQFSKLLEENPGTPAPRGAGDADESEKAVL